jgi:c-di-AMP phosphodiesterase-like protein
MQTFYYKLTFLISIIIYIFSLYYTYTNDFGMFLFLILLLFVGLFTYGYIEYRIEVDTAEIKSYINSLKNQFHNEFPNYGEMKYSNIVENEIDKKISEYENTISNYQNALSNYQNMTNGLDETRR